MATRHLKYYFITALPGGQFKNCRFIIGRIKKKKKSEPLKRSQQRFVRFNYDIHLIKNNI